MCVCVSVLRQSPYMDFWVLGQSSSSVTYVSDPEERSDRLLIEWSLYLDY